MKNSKTKNIIILLILASIFNSCTETYPLLTNTYEEAIVVEATLTNELKHHEIKISKTSRFEEEGINSEKGAKVSIHDDKGNTYIFKEDNDKYISEQEFKAAPENKYNLEIITSDGNKYQSTEETLTTETPIESVTAAIVSTPKEGRGIQINVNSFDPTNTSKYYRYEYEETYKIVTPKWRGEKLVVTGPETLALVPNNKNSKICYSTKTSNEIILTTSTNLQEDRINFPIRFINDQNYIIGNRYSILVKQYIQNLESYNFYKIMKEISSTSAILSPKQPGVLSGNIKCTTNLDKKAIGFFQVSSFSSKRIFFNYKDLFPDEDSPPYITKCDEQEYNFCFGFNKPPCRGDELINGIMYNTLSYTANIEDKIYFAVPVECGDCTSFSSNIIPSFWIE